MVFARMLLALVVAFGCLAGPPAHASDLPGVAVATCVAPVRPGDTAAAMMASPDRFDCARSQTAFGAGDFWVRARAVPTAFAGWPAVVRTASLWSARQTLWARYADGRVTRVSLDERAISRHLDLGAQVTVRLPANRTRLTGLLWRIDGAANLRGVLTGVMVQTPSERGEANLIMGALYAAFAGLTLALLIHGLALWAALRHRFQFAYCVMLTALLGYMLTSSGGLAWLWPDLPNTLRLRFNYVLLAMLASAALLFARTYFEERVFAGWLDRALNAVVGAMLATSVAFLFFAPLAVRLLDALYSWSFVGMLLLIPPVLVRAWRRESRYLWLFVAAWSVPAAMAAARVANNFNLLPASLWLDNSTMLAQAIESLLFALAIAYRVHGLSRERDEARAAEIAATLLADTDPLTGLLNRRAFLRQAIGRPGPQTLVLADLDHFKQVNETIGHDGGDDVLKAFSRLLTAVAPPGALVARIGGEEFVILTDQDAAVVPEAILTRLRGARMPFDMAVTVSIGACHGPMTSEPDWKTLYARADRALFEAKRAGRDRARFAPPPAPRMAA